MNLGECYTPRSMFPEIIVPIGSGLSLADEKAESVSKSLTNYPGFNALAAPTTSGQITMCGGYCPSWNYGRAGFLCDK